MLSHLSITLAHQKLKNGEITCVELVQSCLRQIDTYNDTLNVVVHRHDDLALAAAKKIDAKGDFTHPLTGIPYLAKDNFCEEGRSTTACSNVLQDRVYMPPYNATVIGKLNAAGAISLGKSNTDEFTMGSSTETSCFGPTMNPWDTTKIAGGSSGGSAAGIASGMCLFALGTDTGGSIRLPASFCNVVSIRPTYGLTSRYGVLSMASSLDTIGPMARTIEDMSILLQTMAGHDPHDATSAQKNVPDYPSLLHGSIQGVKIGLPKEYFIAGIDPEVESAVRKAADTLQTMGAEIIEISLPHTKYAVAVYCVLAHSEVSSNMTRYDGIAYGHTTKNTEYLNQYYTNVRTEGFGDEVKRRIMLGTYALSAGYFDEYYLKALKVRRLIAEDFEQAFKEVDIIVSPVSPTPAFALGAHEDDPIAMYLEDIFLDSQPMAGIPVVALPSGFSSKTLPIGIQIMGPQWSEELLLRVGHAYQGQTEWHKAKPVFAI